MFKIFINQIRYFKEKLQVHIMSKLIEVKSAFTILEIIIVVIIIGVLASLALPRFGPMIEQARATEALSTIAGLRGFVEKCYLMTSDYSKCTGGGSADWSALGIENPAAASNSHFRYLVDSSTNNSISYYEIHAIRNSYELLATPYGGMAGGGIVFCAGQGSMPALLSGTLGALYYCSGDGQIHGSGYYIQ